MKFLFRKYPAKKGEIIELGLSAPAPVKFMTASEFKKYTGSRTHTYYKGREEDGTIRFTLPFDNIWHAVVENSDNVSATSKLCPPAPQEMQLNAARNGFEENAEDEIESLSMGSRSEG